MKAPNKPKEEDCCNSGCNPCIFDVYDKRLQLYEKLKLLGNETKAAKNGICDIKYTPFVVTDLIHISSSQIILKFKNITIEGKTKVWWNPGDHFLLKYTSDANVSCSRAYTPIKLKIHGCENYDFLIVVKRYDHGVVSNYLCNLNIGDETMWRGPYGSYKLYPNKYVSIIMIAQGTGIAPFISIIDTVLNNDEDMTRIVLCFCCKNENEILFRNELYEYKSYWNFSYTIFLSRRSEAIEQKFKYQEPIVYSRFDVKHLNYLKPFTASQIMVCGSLDFMEEYKNILSNDTENLILF